MPNRAAALSISRSSAKVITGRDDTAIGRHRAGVRDDAARNAVVGSNLIGARQLGHRHQRLDAAGRWKTGIGADIGDDVRRQRGEPGVLVERAFERDDLIAAVKSGHQIFPPVFGPGHRAAQLPRQPHQDHVFRRQRHLLAEPAADVGRNHAQIGFRHAEHIGDCGPRQMRHLRGAGQRDAARRRVVGGMPGLRLQRRGVLPARQRLEFDPRMRRRQRRIEIRRLDPALQR